MKFIHKLIWTIFIAFLLGSLIGMAKGSQYYCPKCHSDNVVIETVIDENTRQKIYEKRSLDEVPDDYKTTSHTLAISYTQMAARCKACGYEVKFRVPY